MKQIRKRLTYANVMSSIAVFLTLSGATAFAASKIGSNRLKPNSVGTAKIKANAVTTRKLKKNAVTTLKIRDNAIKNGKIADGAVTTAKIANEAVTGAKIDAASAPFSRVTDRLRGTAQVPFSNDDAYPLGNPTYVQPAGRTDQYVAAIDLTFDAGCLAPRAAEVWLLLDAADPDNPMTSEIAAFVPVLDTGTGTVNRRIQLTPFANGRAMATLAPSTATQHTFTLVMKSSNCGGGGSGITVTGAGIDVIGTR